MKKRISAIILFTFLITSSALGGCGKSADGRGNVPPEDSAAESSAPGITISDETDSPEMGKPEGTGEQQAQNTAAETENAAEAGSLTAREAEEYLLPESSQRRLTEEDLSGLSGEELKLARNEIYARHGRKFKSEEIQNYFNSKSWYKGAVEPDKFQEDELNQFEKDNIRLLLKAEQNQKPQGPSQDYLKIMKENDILDQYGLTDYGRVNVSSFGGELKDRGDYYEATGQRLRTPVYYDWNYVKHLKPGDQISYTYEGKTKKYEITNILKESEKKYRVVETKDPEEESYYPLFSFENYFHDSQYVMLSLGQGLEDEYTGYEHYPRDNGLVDCSEKVLYEGSFRLSKDCLVKAEEEYTVEQIMSGGPTWGYIYGWIREIDENGYITYIDQQIAG